jgi:glycosyltransferase involved in cell wall biosynthesis
MAANGHRPVRVLYSFPHKIGAERICNTAWQLVNGLARAGAEVRLLTASICRPLPSNVRVSTTLAWGRLRIPYKLIGHSRAWALHDTIVAGKLRRLSGKIDVVSVWPMGALRTLKTARALGIPSFLERPNAHTKFAYEIVQEECRRLGITMPRGHEHAYNAEVLEQEEKEYALADYLLCPSEFVAQTFRDSGFTSEKLVRHQYGYDEKVFFPRQQDATGDRGLIVLFAGGCAPRKGLHYALQAWLQSTAHQKGEFLIAGEFIPGYAEKLSPWLEHPSVKVLGFRKDVPELMRRADIFTLPSIEEGSALVTSEARGCGCVLLVSEAAGAICEHGVNGLVHTPRDMATLQEHFTRLDQDRELLKRLRDASLAAAPEITWTAAGKRLLSVYREPVRQNQELSFAK